MILLIAGGIAAVIAWQRRQAGPPPPAAGPPVEPTGAPPGGPQSSDLDAAVPPAVPLDDERNLGSLVEGRRSEAAMPSGANDTPTEISRPAAPPGPAGEPPDRPGPPAG